MLNHIFVFHFHNSQELFVVLLGFFVADEGMRFQATIEFVQDDEWVDTAAPFVENEGVGDLVLNVAWRDTVETFAGGFFAKFLNVIFGKARDGLAVIEL